VENVCFFGQNILSTSLPFDNAESEHTETFLSMLSDYDLYWGGPPFQSGSENLLSGIVCGFPSTFLSIFSIALKWAVKLRPK
jgi:hypothetical protein